MKINKNKLVILCITICMLMPCTVRAEVNNEAVYPITTNDIKNWPQSPDLYSDTAVLMEADTGTILYDKGMNEKRYPASITKIMTALLALEHCGMDEEVTFTESGIQFIAEGSNIGMQAGEVLTMEQCLHAVMIKSANEVADQVAEYVGGSREQFVQMMNERAAAAGASNTHFNNPSGLPDENHWSTAYDMAAIFREALKNEEFCKIIQTLQYTIPATNMNPQARELTSHHALLVPSAPEYYEGCLGGKTGVTDVSKNTLVTGAKRDDMRLIAVVMRADAGQVCADTTSLFDYGYNSFERLDVQGGTLVVPKGTKESELKTTEDKSETEVLESYYFNDHLVGTATLTLEQYNARQEKEDNSKQIEDTKQSEIAETEGASGQDTANSKNMIDIYRIIIVVLSVFILISLIIIIVKAVSRKGKKRSRRK